jgi:hypothetical protein
MKILFLLGLLLNVGSLQANTACDRPELPQLLGGDLPFPFDANWEVGEQKPLMAFSASEPNVHLAVYKMPSARLNNYVLVKWNSHRGQATWVEGDLHGLLTVDRKDVPFLLEPKTGALWLGRECTVLQRQ